MTKDDYIQWRTNTVTEEFLGAVIEQMDYQIADLIKSAGDNSLLDRYRRGVIEGLRFLTDWEPDFDIVEVEEEEDEDSSSGASASY